MQLLIPIFFEGNTLTVSSGGKVCVDRQQVDKAADKPV